MAHEPATRTSSGGRLARRGEHPLERLRSDFDSLFGRLLGGGWLSPLSQDWQSMRIWDFDVKENESGEIEVRAEVPGFEPNELDVQINKGRADHQGRKGRQGQRS
jgi:HSP20 family molecular chaperone IbpA